MSDSNRERILTACAKRIATDGVRRLRVSDVASEAAVSVGLVYYHFTDREGLVSATLDFIHESSRVRLHEGESCRDGDPVLRALLTDIEDRTEVRENSIVWNEIRAISVFDEGLRRSLQESTDQWQTDVAEDLAGASIRLDRPRAALLLTALIEGVSGRWLTHQITEAEARAVIADAWRLIQNNPSEISSDPPT